MEHKPPISEKIMSLRESVGVEYVRPSLDRVAVLVKELWGDLKAQQYLLERGLSEETIKHFQLGYDANLGAISIPVFKNGELVNIKYRIINPTENKYTGERGAEPWLFNEEGIKIAHKKGFVVVTEGEFDAMSLWQIGVKNVVSPSSGKDSFGIWLAMIDSIPRIYIGYDNDTPGKEAARKMAERLGQERCFEVSWGDCKDANEFLSRHPQDDFKGVLKSAKPFLRQQFKTMGDVIDSLRRGDVETIASRFIPQVNFEKGWMAIISGRSNVGKTSYVMNVANELANRDIPTLVLPFERGVESVGKRFLQVRHNATLTDFEMFGEEDWDRVKVDAAELPVYFAMPDKEDTVDFILKAKKYFDIKVVIVDHLDYMVRQVSSGSRGDAIMDTLQRLKRAAEEAGIVLLIVSHIRKTEKPGTFIARHRKPNIEDLKGSSSLYQDPEVVVMLYETYKMGEISVDVLKNKGEMGAGVYNFNASSGVYGDNVKHTTSLSEIAEAQVAAEEMWNTA